MYDIIIIPCVRRAHKEKLPERKEARAVDRKTGLSDRT